MLSQGSTAKEATGKLEDADHDELRLVYEALSARELLEEVRAQGLSSAGAVEKADLIEILLSGSRAAPQQVRIRRSPRNSNLISSTVLSSATDTLLAFIFCSGCRGTS